MSSTSHNQYSFVTIWQIAADIEDVWDTLIRFQVWPTWWRGLKSLSRSERHNTYALTCDFIDILAICHNDWPLCAKRLAVIRQAR